MCSVLKLDRTLGSCTIVIRLSLYEGGERRQGEATQGGLVNLLICKVAVLT